MSGLTTSLVAVDELQQAFNELRYQMLTRRTSGPSPVEQQISKPKKVLPRQIACRYCGAQPGEKCTKWRRAKHNRKIRVSRSQPHGDRIYDAKLATDALNALTK